MAVINKSASIGSSLTLRATPNRGYEFDHWSDLDSGSADYSNTSRTYIVKSSGNALEAIFRPHNLGAIQAIESSGYTISSGNVLIQNQQSGDLIVDIKVDPNKEWIHAIEVTGLETNEYQIMSKTKTNVVIKFFESILRKLHQAIIKLIDRFGSSVTCTATRSVQTSTITIQAGEVPTNLFSSSTGTINWSGSTGTLVADQGTPITLTIGDLTGFDVNFVHGSNKSNPFTFTPSQDTYNITTTKERLYNIIVRMPDGSQRFTYENRTYELRYPTHVKSGVNVRVDTELVENVNDMPSVTDFYGYARDLALKIGDKIYGNTIPNVTSDIEAMAYYCKQLIVQGAKIKTPWGEIINGEYTILHSPIGGSLPFIRVVNAFGNSGGWEILVETDKVFKGWKLKSTMMSDDSEFEGRDNFPTEGAIYPWIVEREEPKNYTFVDNGVFFNTMKMDTDLNLPIYRAVIRAYGDISSDEPSIIKTGWGPTLWESFESIDHNLSVWEVNGRVAKLYDLGYMENTNYKDTIRTTDYDVYTIRSHTNGGMSTSFIFKTPGEWTPRKVMPYTFDIPTEHEYSSVDITEIPPFVDTIEAPLVNIYFFDAGNEPDDIKTIDKFGIMVPQPIPVLWDLDKLARPDGLRVYKTINHHSMDVDPVIERGLGYVKLSIRHDIKENNPRSITWEVKTYIMDRVEYLLVNDHPTLSGGNLISKDESGMIDVTNLYRAFETAFGVTDLVISNSSGTLVRPIDDSKSFQYDPGYGEGMAVMLTHSRGHITLNITTMANVSMFTSQPVEPNKLYEAEHYGGLVVVV